MKNPQKLLKKYDHILIGFNLTSVSFAYELAQQNKSFCLLDSKHFGSHPFKNIFSIDTEVYSRLPFNSFSENTLNNVEESDNPLTTFDKGAFKSFLGFGDTKIESMDAVLPYCQAKGLITSETPENFWNMAKERLNENIFLDQKLTDIRFDDNLVSSVTLNGKTEISGENFYFFDQFPFLIDKVGPQIKKLASQFAKAKWYSSTNLIVHHKKDPETFELDQLYLLKGSKEQACLGWFTRIGDELISRWESFYPAELTADSETTGTTLKEIKKQIKRAFSPNEPLDAQEHILIQKNVYADLGKTGLTNGKLGNFSNLSIYSPLFSNQIGWAHEQHLGSSAALAVTDAQKSTPEPPIEVAAPSSP